MTNPEHPEVSDDDNWLTAGFSPTASAINHSVERTIFALASAFENVEEFAAATDGTLRLGSSPDMPLPQHTAAHDLLLINQVEGGQAPDQSRVRGMRWLASKALCVAAGWETAEAMAKKYGISPQEVPGSSAINWRREAGLAIEESAELWRKVALKPRPGEVHTRPVEEPNAELYDHVRVLLVARANCNVMSSMVMLSGHSKSFNALRRASTALSNKVNNAPILATVKETNALIPVESMDGLSEIVGRVGLMPYLSLVTLSLINRQTKQIVEELENDPEKLALAQEQQREALHQCANQCANPKVRTALGQLLNTGGGTAEEVTVDLETPDGRAYRISGSSGKITASAIESTVDWPAVRAGSTEQSAADIARLPNIHQLDWEILPEGQLQDRARTIVKNASHSKNSQRQPSLPQIDLTRMSGLEQVREFWGQERSGYFTGRFDKRRRIRVATTESDQDQATTEDNQSQKEVKVHDDYVLLVLRELEADGSIAMEHVVAESPIAGRNSLIILRGDVREGNGTGRSWQEIMKWSKSEVEAAGGRALNHVEVSGISLEQAMILKVNELLTCEPHKFKTLRFDGYDAAKQQLRIREGRA